ncbi:MAG TPA: GtrA family protein, partial [Actinomycetota bacterium]|nr:GtrA family protein [Actinomycetota bacterium]
MKTLAKLIRFAAVSAVSTLTALTLLGLLVGLAGAPAGWSNAFATAVATVPSFELNRRWVWGAQASRSLVRQAAPLFALSMSGLVLSTLTVHV